MIKLPKYRWDSIHDIIMRIIMTNPEAVIDANEIMPKLFSIVHKAVYLKKTLSKKSTSAFTNYDISARVVVYCIYC